jgi:RimJ/RimL family protein N-acetyltransferase
MREILLRRAQPADAATLFTWRNDPWILSHGSQGRAVRAAEHAAWYARSLTSPDHLLLIIETDAGEGIGSVRFDRERPDSAAISIYLLRNFTGRGLGVMALHGACTLAFENWPELQHIDARVLPGNEPSRRAFEKAGFDHAPAPRADPSTEEITLTLTRRAWIARRDEAQPSVNPVASAGAE